MPETTSVPTGAPAQPLPARDRAYRAFLLTALTAAVFCLWLTVGLLIHHVRSKVDDPLRSPQLLSLKEKLRAEPKNESLKEEIRALDLRLRRTYFWQISYQVVGGWLLLGGAAVLVWSGRQAALCRATPFLPKVVTDAADRQERTAALARRAVAVVAGVFSLTFLALGWSSTTVLPRHPGEVEKFLAKLAGGEDLEIAGPPSPEEYARNWPRFLGPTSRAVTTNQTLPDGWDVATGSNILWRASLTNAGFNSPVVWSNRVFVSAGDAQLREVFCYEAGTGALVWRKPVTNVPGSPAQAPEIPEGTGFAASTMATDGRRAFAFFANGDLAAFRFDGSLAWAKNLGVPKNQYGHASSLVPWQDCLLVQLDQGEAEQARSRLYAFEAATGRLRWERTRQIPESWATPCVAETPSGPQIITLGGQWVIAYAAKDGAELWRGDFLTGEITPSPIAVGGLVLAISPNDKMVALRPDGQGDVTKSHLAWTAEDNMPDIGSPVSDGALIYTANTPGMLTCFDAKDGKKQWEQDLGFEVNATPVLAGDRLVVLGRKGAVAIVHAAREFKPIAQFDMGEGMFASPAVVGDRLFIRTTRTLYCIGRRAEEANALEVKR